ncbi:antibiotic acetyltransferase, partial [Micromonospora sp. 15K316]
MVDSCPTWSLAPIDHRACHTGPEPQDQLGKGS